MVLEAVCRRLNELHQAGIVHCDLKHDNVMVSLTPIDANIIDFGVSMRVGYKSILGRREDWRHILAGSPWYAAEIFTGGPVTPATDVVGLAFLTQHAALVMTQGLPTPVKALMVDAASHDPEQRPSVTDFAKAFAQARKELQPRSSSAPPRM